MAKKTEVSETAKIRKSHNGANKRYSLKVMPKAAKAELKDYNDGVVDVALEAEARAALMKVVKANGGVNSLVERGIKISLYHYRMPLEVVGNESPLSSKDFKAGKEVEKAEPVSVGEVVEDELLAIAEQIRQADEVGDVELKAELIEQAKQLSSQA